MERNSRLNELALERKFQTGCADGGSWIPSRMGWRWEENPRRNELTVGAGFQDKMNWRMKKSRHMGFTDQACEETE